MLLNVLTISRRTLRCVALIASIAITASIASAQIPATRFWMSLGGGYGHSGPSNSTGNDQFSGLTGDAAIGMAMTGRGVIALEGAGFHKETPIGSSTSAFASLTLLGYPFGSGLDNLYFQAGVGVGLASFPTVDTAGVASRLKINRPSLLIGLGFDIPVSCPVWIAPFFQSYGTFGGRRVTGALGPNERASTNAILFHAGLALRFSHPGPSGQCRNRGTFLQG